VALDVTLLGQQRPLPRPARPCPQLLRPSLVSRIPEGSGCGIAGIMLLCIEQHLQQQYSSSSSSTRGGQ
jgi:hypothetical protein